MKANALPDLNYLKECFKLDPSSPNHLKWNENRPEHHFKNNTSYKIWKTRLAGKPCGCLAEGRDINNRYYQTRLNQKNIFNHRIIYAIHNGTIDFNGKLIDHINGDTLNNDPRNLRLVTTSENKLNSKIHKNNKSGYKHIVFCKRKKLYQCQIRIKGKNNWLGYFKTLEEALQARDCFVEKMKLEVGNYFRI